GITIPTRYTYNEAAYDEMLKRLAVKRYCFEEEQQVEYKLDHEGRLRDYIFIPEVITRTDFFVNCPKFKAHPWTTVTFSMKNYIGLQDDRHRLIDHDHLLNQKVADLQYIIQPQFIAADAIIAGQGRMLTPIPYDLKLVIMGNNQVAFDSVCCNIIGIDPLSVEHIRLAYERGFGPVELSKIQLSGDVSLDEARKLGRGFQSGLIRVEDYFKDTNIKTYAGGPSEDESCDYCWGGCPGALEEAIEILRKFDPETDQKMPPIHLVFGAYRGEINAKPGEKVVFMGNCADWQGTIAGEKVSINKLPETRAKKDPYYAASSDIYEKMVAVTLRLFRSRKQGYIRLPG
ncbi:MAG: FeS-binding protein, partial [Chloroflexi bacterium RBG_13_46_9]